MPMWHGYWGGPWGGFGWIVPLLGLAFMVLLFVLCMRRMGGMMCGCWGSHAQSTSTEVETLRREVQDLRREIEALRKRS